LNQTACVAIGSSAKRGSLWLLKQKNTTPTLRSAISAPLQLATATSKTNLKNWRATGAKWPKNAKRIFRE
jgi:hypothetical protein